MATYAPRHVDIWPWTNWYSAVGTPTRLNNSSFLSMGLCYDGTPALNNEVVWNVALDAGTWSFCVIYGKQNDCGIQTWSLDGTTIATVDGYGTGGYPGTPNNASVSTGISVPTAAVYSLKCKVASKHASSSNYQYVLELVTLTRTGA